MEDISMWIIIGILGATIIGYLVYKIIYIVRLSPEERKNVLISYLVSLVNAAEGAIGSGHGAEKLEQVEKWFKEKAPLAYKIILSLIGKENLKDLIEAALEEIKHNFEK